jgi:membrane protease YdiL (CAAX protease family)
MSRAVSSRIVSARSEIPRGNATRGADADESAARIKAAEKSSIEGYFSRSESPLHSLVFVLPLIILFEIGTTFHPSDPIAFRLLQLFFRQLGATGRFVPALSVVGILLAWHIARKDAWKVRLATLGGMTVESVGLSLPLLALGVAVARWHIHVPLSTQTSVWRDDTILSLGAGIYEELTFRLILMTVLMLLFADIFRLQRFWASLLMVSISAVMFSLYHYLGHEPFVWQSFVFRTVAGIYFAVLFLTRGFGVTAGCHIAYDMIIVALQAWALR